MTKSRLKVSSVLLLTFIISLAAFGLIWTISKANYVDKDFIVYYFILLTMFVLVWAVYILLRDTRKIEINDNEIKYTNWLTGVTTKYRLNEIDGFVITLEITSGGQYRTIYIVKDGKMNGKISEFFYKNIDELHSAIQKAKYLGRFNWNLINSIKIFLGQKIKIE